MVNRLNAIEEINLSDDDDGSEWNYINRRNTLYEDHYSKNNRGWHAQQQDSEEPTVWVDEMGNSYYEQYEPNIERQTYDHPNYAQDGDYYDESYQQDYDQAYYYDESQGTYVYYEDQTEYDYTYNSQSYAPTRPEATRPMPTGLFQSKHAPNGYPADVSVEEEQSFRPRTERGDSRANRRSGPEPNASNRNLQRLQQRRVDASNCRPFVRRGSGPGIAKGGSSKPGIAKSGSSKPTSSTSASPETLRVDESGASEDDEPASPARRRHADDDSDEDPHFRTSFRKSELKEGGESRSLRSKGSPPPILGHIPRVSAGKVMSRKRNKSSSKTKPSTSSSSSKPSSAAASPPDLVCIDSDASDGEDDKKITARKIKLVEKTKSSSKKIPAASSSHSMVICIDSGNDHRKSVVAKKKRKYRVKDRTLIMPVHKYYYGWAEGEKTSNPHQMFRFRCSRDSCQHVTYDNISAMRHAISHVKDDDISLDADIFSELMRCPTCFLPFKSRYEMQSHFEKEHPASATKSKGPHRCKICERELNGQEKFVQHMRLYHVRCDMPYVCPICFYRSSIFNMVVDHFLTSHGNAQEALCPYCLKCISIKPAGEDEKFGDLTGYMSHLADHTIIKRHKCQQCRLYFTKGNHLSTHAQCDHKTAKGEINEIEASLIADHVPITVSEATSKHHESNGGTDGPGASSSASSSPSECPRSQAILASFVMTLGQRAGPQSLTAEGLKAWNLQCKECHRPLDFAGHFRTATVQKFVQCSKCKFITTCSFSYAKHMIFFHGTAADRGKIVPAERKVKHVSSLRCRACEFTTEFGNKMAAHMMKAGHAAGGCVAEKIQEKMIVDETEDARGSNADPVTGKHESFCPPSATNNDAADAHDSTLEILDSDDSEDDDDDAVEPETTESIARDILNRILSDIDPDAASSETHIIVDGEGRDDVGGRIGDVDETDKPGTSNEGREDTESVHSDTSDASPASPEIIALSDSDEEDG